MSDTEGSVRLIDLTEEGSEAPFAVREADGSTGAVPRRIPDRAEILAWLEEHPVGVGIATGVLCFAIIASAMSIVVGSDSNSDSDDPAASAALSETDGGQGSFSSSGSGGANFTSDESKLSRSGAGKVVDGSADGESAAGANPDGSPARNSQSTDPWSGGASNLDQSATLNGRTPGGGNGAGQAAGPGSSTTLPVAAGANAGPATPGATGTPATTLNPGPNLSAPMPTTATTSRATTPTNQTTATTARQTSSTSPSSAPTTAATTPTTAATIPTTPPPASLMIASPGHGSIHPFESSTNFSANYIAGATQYCWTFIQSGATAHQSCSSGTSYQLPAYPDGLGPGLVTVKATATGSFGTLADTIQISLYRAMVINNPTQDLTIGRSPLRIGVVNLIGATQYCFRLTQAGYDSGTLCYSTPGKTFSKSDPIWDLLSPGPLTVSATIHGGGLTLAADSVTIQLL